ncbi:high nitrogen upregulated cytochrome P450 monooxygenase 2 [Athelia psychrophila]|uniref:High nitrogen upregulated cytochrome P450 monooxygenase 2 n=1 Tax=Athelia psychrophila TaxID=1759441 RepID=A0A166P9V5_9AGAM|nr:high nitrogen upregulated cytochrome P450 monooxygenase 2 [Fibularhizoctonia sp. CBS 109695]
MLEIYDAWSKSLRLSDCLLIVLTTSLVVYQIFKRYEPNAPLPVAILLLFVPALLVPLVAPHTPNTLLAIPFTFVVYWASIITYVSAYRLSPFHPLANYPGPVLGKLSKLTLAWKMYRGRQHLYYQKLHKQYGDIVRVGPNELSINRADVIAPVLGNGGLPRGVWYYNRFRTGAPSSLINFRDVAQHKARRRVWDRAFSTASAKGYEELVIRRTVQLCEAFEKRSGQVLDFSLWMNFFSYDFMGDFVFGAGFNMVETGSDETGIWQLFHAKNVQTATLAHIPWAFTYQRLIPGIGGPREKFLKIVKGIVARRVQRGSVTKDLFYYLTDEEGLEPTKPTMPVVFSDGGLAIVAGSDTTSTTLSVLWYFLLVHPEHFQRLRAEIDQFFPDRADTIDFTKMAGMPFLNACINEALRLVPPILDGSPRCSPEGSQGSTIGPYYIPPDQQVITHFYSIQHNPAYFTDPDAFVPDRWLPSSAFASAPSVKHDVTAFNPFSYGPMACVGKNVAMLELRAVTCALAQRFDIGRPEGFQVGEWERGLRNSFVVRRPPLMMKLQARTW